MSRAATRLFAAYLGHSWIHRGALYFPGDFLLLQRGLGLFQGQRAVFGVEQVRFVLTRLRVYVSGVIVVEEYVLEASLLQNRLELALHFHHRGASCLVLTLSHD